MCESVNKYFGVRVNCFKMPIYSLIAFLLALYSPIACTAQSKPKQYLLALSKADHTLAIVNSTTFNVIAKIPVGTDPHEVVASSDGKTAYVSSYGGGTLHELDIIDLVSQKIVSRVDTKTLIGLHGLMFANGKAWFTAEGSKSVGRYNPGIGRVDWSMATGQDRTHMIYVTADGKNVYTANVNSGTISVLTDTSGSSNGNLHKNWASTVIPVSKSCEGFDVSPNGRELWTAAATDGSIFIINLATKKVIGKIDAKAIGANRLKFTPDGKRVLISSLRTGDLYIYDTASQKELKRINTGNGAAGILVTPDGSRAFIGCSADNYVAVVDLKSMQVTDHIDVGRNPDGLAWAVQP